MNPSLAVAQRSLGDPSLTYPLFPPLLEGCPRTSTADLQYPLELDYDYAHVDAALFDQPPLPGLERWSPLLPPLAAGLSMGEGGTPLIPAPKLATWMGFDGELFIKDESRNPTWSHKDRLQLCAVSAAVQVGAAGVVVSSSGNHGAAAAAYAARAGLPCIVLITAGGSPVIQHYVRSYGAAVLAVPREARVPLLRQIVARLGYHPVSSTTPTHTGHPFGPEGYKTLAYEVFLQLGRRVPAAMFVPTGYAELFYGVWKGFRELRRLGMVDRTPQMVACEPASRAPLAKALAENRPVVEVPLAPTDAYSVAVNANGYRGVLTVRQSEGLAVAPTDAQMVEAQAAAGRTGLWAELSSVSSVAGLRLALAQGHRFDGPVVCVSTSSGFKDWGIGRDTAPEIAPDWETVTRTLRDAYGLKV